MAKVANYYYNSPWIADAGRNLASALAPPDPDKTFARQRAAFELEQAHEKARIDEELRADQAIGRNYLAQLGQLDPIMMEDGTTVDKEATFNAARDLYSNAILHRIDPKQAEAVAGVFGPGFGAKSELAELGFGNRLDLQASLLAGQMRREEFEQGQQNARTVFTASNQRTLQEMKGNLAFQLAARKAAAARTAGGKPTKMTQNDYELATWLVMSLEDQTGQKLLDLDRTRMVNFVLDQYQAGGNPQEAALQIWENTMGNTGSSGVQTPGPWAQMMGRDPYSGYARPNFSKVAQPGGSNFSDAMPGAGITPTVDIPAGMVLPPGGGLAGGTPAPTPKPPAASAAPKPTANGAPKKGDRAKSKSGKDMIYDGTGWVYAQ